MTQLNPKVGQRYNCREQSRMHGGDSRSTLPDSDGAVTLIRFRLDRNPDGPHIIDHGPPKSLGSRSRDRVEMLRHQKEPIPVYRHEGGDAWEYLGLYRVLGISEDAKELAKRTQIRGRPTGYVIRLEEVS